MAGLALALFVGLATFGSKIFEWSDPHGRVQIALFASFVFGVIAGYRSASA